MPIDLEAMQTGRWTPADVWATIAELTAARKRVAELKAHIAELEEACIKACMSACAKHALEPNQCAVDGYALDNVARLVGVGPNVDRAALVGKP